MHNRFGFHKMPDFFTPESWPFKYCNGEENHGRKSRFETIGWDRVPTYPIAILRFGEAPDLAKHFGRIKPSENGE
jgi:hypothetical protein